MRVRFAWSLMTAFLIAATPAIAGKIGFVDAERAVATVKQGQAKIGQLDQWARPERERVESLGAKVNELRSRLAQQRSVASAEVVESLEREELQARREFEDARRNFERELDKKQNEFLGDVAVKVGSVAAEYGRANDYDAIFVLKAQPLVYVADSADLTDIVIRLYDERFPLEGE